MTDLELEIERLQQLVDRRYQLNLADALQPGLTAKQIETTIAGFADLPATVDVPLEIYDWYTWQNGFRPEAELRQDQRLSPCIGPAILGPTSLTGTAEVFQLYEPAMISDDVIIPVAGMTNHLLSYRLHNTSTWHMSIWSDDTQSWSNPEDPTSGDWGEMPIASQFVTITEWLAALNNAHAQGRIVRGSGNYFQTTDPELRPYLPWD